MTTPPCGPRLRAVIDIGSNSVRLVVYETDGAIMTPVFNEKVMCALGAGVAEDGRLDDTAVEATLDALTRFRALCAVMHVEEIVAVATAAVRAAQNGEAFVAEAAERGVAVRVLSGAEEARFAAYGVLSGAPDAAGLVADLGGGSLECAAVSGDWRAVSGAAQMSEPLGALALMRACDNPAAARAYVLETLQAHDWLRLDGRADLHLVGGAWRNIARLEMDRRDHPIEILQGFAMTARECADLARFVAGLGPRTIERTPGVSKKRADALPYAAAALEALVARAKPARVIVSSSGVREGVLFDALPDGDKDHDPLLDGAARIAVRLSRDPSFGREAADWVRPVAEAAFGADARRLRLSRAAGLCADVAWRRPPAYRGRAAFDEIMFSGLSGLDHPERAALSLMMFHRYEGAGGDPPDAAAARLCDEDLSRGAAMVGAGLRLAATLSGRAGGVLERFPMTVDETRLVLNAPAADAGLVGEAAQKRLNQLAGLMGRDWVVSVV